MSKVLLAGESWVSAVTDHKGFDAFPHTQLHIGCKEFVRALEKEGHGITHIPSHRVAEDFPLEIEELNKFDVVILSDVGANTMLLHPKVFEEGRPVPNRLRLLREWVKNGGGLMMAGGYLSFQGFEAKAHYAGSPIEEVLPVNISHWDDRVEEPQGVSGELTKDHWITEGLDAQWPILLGYQLLEPKDDAETLATVDGSPLLVVHSYGAGRSVAFSSDISPHWAPREFMEWDGYGRLFSRIVKWVGGEEK